MTRHKSQNKNNNHKRIFKQRFKHYKKIQNKLKQINIQHKLTHLVQVIKSCIFIQFITHVPHMTLLVLQNSGNNSGAKFTTDSQKKHLKTRIHWGMIRIKSCFSFKYPSYSILNISVQTRSFLCILYWFSPGLRCCVCQILMYVFHTVQTIRILSHPFCQWEITVQFNGWIPRLHRCDKHVQAPSLVVKERFCTPRIFYTLPVKS